MSYSDSKILDIVKGVLENKELSLPSDISENDELTLYGLNSITAMELIAMLEDELGIQIEDEDLNMENVCTLKKIKEMIMKYI